MLLWLALVPALGALAWASHVVGRRRLQRFAFAGLLPRLLLGASTGRVLALGALRLTALALAVVALARPQWGRREEPVVRKGVDVVLALDLSASMLAEDVSPNRLEQARAEAVSLVSSLTGDRVALVTFGGRAAVVCPLTVDYGAIRLFLDAADASFAPGAGTDLGRALSEGVRLLVSSGSSEKRFKSIVLLSDGEDLEGHGIDAIAKAREAGIAVHAIGVGSPVGGPIPLRDDAGNLTGYKKDRQGRVVTTRLDPSVLEQFALATDGTFLQAGPAGDAGGHVAEAISKMEKREIASRLATRFEDRYQIPLAAALLLLGIEAAWIPRRPRVAARAPSARPVARSQRETSAEDVDGAAPDRLRSAGVAALVLAAGTTLLSALILPAPARAGEDTSDAQAGQERNDEPAREGSAGPAPATGSSEQKGERTTEDTGGKTTGGARGTSGSRRYLDAGRSPSPDVARANREGNRFYGRALYPEAMSKYEAAGAGAPNVPAVRYNMGNALMKQGKIKEAASEYRRALQSAPASLAPAIRYNLGNAEYLQGQYREAADSYLKVLEKAPTDEAARRNLELALRALQRPESPQPKDSKDQKDKNDEKQDQQSQSSSGGSQEQKGEKSSGQGESQEDGKPPEQGEKPEGSDSEGKGQDGQQELQDQDPNEGQGPEDERRKDGKRGGKPEQGKIGRKEAERLLDSLADEERKDLKRRLARKPREDGPEKDW